MKMGIELIRVRERGMREGEVNREKKDTEAKKELAQHPPTEIKLVSLKDLE